VLIEPHGERHDPAHCVTHRLEGDVGAVLRVLDGSLSTQPDAPRKQPLAALASMSTALDVELTSAFAWRASNAGAPCAERCTPSTSAAASKPPCACADRADPLSQRLAEGWVARHLCTVLACDAPPLSPLADEAAADRRDGCAAAAGHHLLFCSNSLPIRHLDMYCPVAPLVLSNRGASGIDGIVHTAIGAALANPHGTTTCLVGDLATLHDLGALATLSAAHCALTVVVLNNGGGGIFRYLPISSHDVFSPYFDTPHSHTFAAVCRGFGLQYEAADRAEQFEHAYAAAIGRRTISVIEVFSDREETYQTHQRVAEAARLMADAAAAFCTTSDL